MRMRRPFSAVLAPAIMAMVLLAPGSASLAQADSFDLARLMQF